MKEIVLALTIIFVGAGLVAYGAYGCSNGSYSHGFAIFAGIMMLASQTSTRKTENGSDEERKAKNTKKT